MDYHDDTDLVRMLRPFAAQWGLTCPEVGHGLNAPHIAHGYARGIYFRIAVWIAYEYTDTTSRHAITRSAPGRAHFETRLPLALDFQLPPSDAAHIERQERVWTPAAREHLKVIEGFERAYLDNQGMHLKLNFAQGPLRIDINGITRSMIGITQEVEQARHNLPVAPEFAPYEDVWKRCATQFHLTLLRAPLCVYGSLRGSSVYCYARRGDKLEPIIFLRVSLARPLGLGLNISSMTLKDRFDNLFGSQDIKTGDPEFDRRFQVTGNDPIRIKAALNESARQAIQELDGAKRLHIDDAGIDLALDEGVSGLERIEEVVAASEKLVRSIDQNAQRSAYR